MLVTLSGRGDKDAAQVAERLTGESVAVNRWLESHLPRPAATAGRKLLVPYVTGGLGAGWLDVVRAVAAAGADAIEIGIPFSDPMMDGRTIQEASPARARPRRDARRASSTTPRSLDVDVPLVGDDLLQPRSRHMGYRALRAPRSRDAGVAGAIVPDLPLDELDGWGDAADAAGVETVLLAAPTTPDDRLAAICERSRGFVYGVSLLGVTGERAALASQARRDGPAAARRSPTSRCCSASASPTPSRRSRRRSYADGVIVGSALVRRLLDGGGPDAAHAFVAELRAALDRA